MPKQKKRQIPNIPGSEKVTSEQAQTTQLNGELILWNQSNYHPMVTPVVTNSQSHQVLILQNRIEYHPVVTFGTNYQQSCQTSENGFENPPMATSGAINHKWHEEFLHQNWVESNPVKTPSTIKQQSRHGLLYQNRFENQLVVTSGVIHQQWRQRLTFQNEPDHHHMETLSAINEQSHQGLVLQNRIENHSVKTLGAINHQSQQRVFFKNQFEHHPGVKETGLNQKLSSLLLQNRVENQALDSPNVIKQQLNHVLVLQNRVENHSVATTVTNNQQSREEMELQNNVENNTMNTLVPSNEENRQLESLNLRNHDDDTNYHHSMKCHCQYCTQIKKSKLLDQKRDYNLDKEEFFTTEKDTDSYIGEIKRGVSSETLNYSLKITNFLEKLLRIIARKGPILLAEESTQSCLYQYFIKQMVDNSKQIESRENPSEPNPATNNDERGIIHYENAKDIGNLQSIQELIRHFLENFQNRKDISEWMRNIFTQIVARRVFSKPEQIIGRQTEDHETPPVFSAAIWCDRNKFSYYENIKASNTFPFANAAIQKGTKIHTNSSENSDLSDSSQFEDSMIQRDFFPISSGINTAMNNGPDYEIGKYNNIMLLADCAIQREIKNYKGSFKVSDSSNKGTVDGRRSRHRITEIENQNLRSLQPLDLRIHHGNNLVNEIPPTSSCINVAMNYDQNKKLASTFEKRNSLPLVSFSIENDSKISRDSSEYLDFSNEVNFKDTQVSSCQQYQPPLKSRQKSLMRNIKVNHSEGTFGSTSQTHQHIQQFENQNWNENNAVSLSTISEMLQQLKIEDHNTSLNVNPATFPAQCHEPLLKREKYHIIPAKKLCVEKSISTTDKNPKENTLVLVEQANRDLHCLQPLGFRHENNPVNIPISTTQQYNPSSQEIKNLEFLNDNKADHVMTAFFHQQYEFSLKRRRNTMEPTGFSFGRINVFSERSTFSATQKFSMACPALKKIKCYVESPTFHEPDFSVTSGTDEFENNLFQKDNLQVTTNASAPTDGKQTVTTQTEDSQFDSNQNFAINTIQNKDSLYRKRKGKENLILESFPAHKLPRHCSSFYLGACNEEQFMNTLVYSNQQHKTFETTEDIETLKRYENFDVFNENLSVYPSVLNTQKYQPLEPIQEFELHKRYENNSLIATISPDQQYESLFERERNIASPVRINFDKAPVCTGENTASILHKNSTAPRNPEIEVTKCDVSTQTHSFSEIKTISEKSPVVNSLPERACREMRKATTDPYIYSTKLKGIQPYVGRISHGQNHAINYNQNRGQTYNSRKTNPKFILPGSYKQETNISPNSIAMQYYCNVCKNLYCSNPFFAHNLQTKDFPYYCPACQTRFRFQDCFDFHLEKHTYFRKYECQYCGISCSDVKEITVHLNYCTKAPSKKSGTHTEPPHLM